MGLTSKNQHTSSWPHISVCSVLTAGDGGVCGRAQPGVHLCRGGLQSGARVHRRLHLPVHACQGPERVSRRGDVLQADQRLDLSAAPLHSDTFTLLPLLLYLFLTTQSWPHHNCLKTDFFKILFMRMNAFITLADMKLCFRRAVYCFPPEVICLRWSNSSWPLYMTYIYDLWPSLEIRQLCAQQKCRLFICH